MSTETVSWKTGACHASVRRRAIVLRIEVELDLLDLAGGAAAAAAGAAFGAATAPRSTSSATIRPSGPLPLQRREVDPLLAREPARERRGLDAAVGTRRRVGDRGGRRLGRRGGGLPAALALVVHLLGGRAPSAAARPLPRAASSASGFVLGFAAGAAPFPDGTSSPSLPMNAIVLPTSTSPESTRILSRTPSASASTSCVTLSVSSS